MLWIRQTLGVLAISMFATPPALALSSDGWVMKRVKRYASENFGVTLDVGELDVDLFSRTPGGTVSNLSIGDGSGNTLVSGADLEFKVGAGSLFRGDLVIARLSISNADIELVVDEQGKGNWQSLLVSSGDEESGSSDNAAGLPEIRSLSIENVDVSYSDRAEQRSASLTLAASGSTTDPEDPLQLEMRGAIDDVPALARVTLVPHGDPLSPPGSLALDGRLELQDAELLVDGILADPVGLEAFDLSVALSAPNGEVIETFISQGVPALGAMRLDGGIVRDAAGWRLRRVVASVGDARVEIGGSLGDAMSVNGLAPDLEFSLSWPDGSDVAPLIDAFTDADLPPLASFSASGGISSDGGDWTLEAVKAQLGETQLLIDGALGNPMSIDEFSPDLELSLSSPNNADIAPLVEAFIDSELPPLESFSASGGVTSVGNDWTLKTVKAQLGETQLWVDGGLGNPMSVDGLAPDLEFSLSGPNNADIAPLVEAFVGTELPPLGPFSASGGITTGSGGWTLQEVRAKLGEMQLRIDGDLGNPLSVDGLSPDITFSLSGPDGSDVASLIDAFTEVELPPLASFAVSGGVTTRGGDWILRDVDAQLGDTGLSVSGAIGDPFGADGIDPRLDVTFDAPGLEDIEAILGSELPAFPPIELTGSVRRDGDDWVLRRFDGMLGMSRVEGDVRIDPSTEPPTLYANVIAPELHLDSLLNAFEVGLTEQEAPLKEDGMPESDSRMLSDESLELRALAGLFNGAVRVRVPDVVSKELPLKSFAGRLEVDGSEIALSSLRIGVAGGTVLGSADLDVAPVPAEGVIDLRLRSIDLKKIAEALDIDDDSFGSLGGRAKYWISGESIASFAADADGGLFLLMTGGELDALLAELASIDVVESVLLLLDPGKTLTNIDCGYLDLQTAGGLTDINRLVLDTRDTVFIADGEIDLADESFDFSFEPHAKDASLLALNTGVRAYGTIDDVSVVPDIELGARAVVTAALAAVAAPVAGLLALVETGAATDSPYCDGLIGQLEEAR